MSQEVEVAQGQVYEREKVGKEQVSGRDSEEMEIRWGPVLKIQPWHFLS